MPYYADKVDEVILLVESPANAQARWILHVPFKKIRTRFVKYPPHILKLFEQKERLFHELPKRLNNATYKNVLGILKYHIKNYSTTMSVASVLRSLCFNTFVEKLNLQP